jgi:RNA polymerase sigma-70 factor (ECF subfamily)
MTFAAAAALPFGLPVDNLRALVEAAQRQDSDAFTELYGRFVRTVHGVLLSRIPRADIDDLVQEVFLTAWQRLGELRDASAFGAWVLTIARRRAVDYVRRTPRLVELPDTLATCDADRSDALRILAVISTLPDAYRETLTLRLVEGMTGPEIAATTGLTEGSVRVNLHRGMKQLRERLERR